MGLWAQPLDREVGGAYPAGAGAKKTTTFYGLRMQQDTDQRGPLRATLSGPVPKEGAEAQVTREPGARMSLQRF